MDSVPLTNLGVSWVSTDANSGALLTGGTTLVGLREGATCAPTSATPRRP